MGITGDSYEWSQGYLNCRSQFTVVNGETSERAPVEQGVPQGSLLGPRFYSYHANNLPEVADSEDQLEDQEQLEMFADDTNGVSVAPTFLINSLYNCKLLLTVYSDGHLKTG